MLEIDSINPEYDAVARQYALMAAVKTATGLDSRMELTPGLGWVMFTDVDGPDVGDQRRVYHSWVTIRPDGNLEGTAEFFAGADDPSPEFIVFADPDAPMTPAEWVAALNDHYAFIPPRTNR